MTATARFWRKPTQVFTSPAYPNQVFGAGAPHVGNERSHWLTTRIGKPASSNRKGIPSGIPHWWLARQSSAGNTLESIDPHAALPCPDRRFPRTYVLDA